MKRSLPITQAGSAAADLPALAAYIESFSGKRVVLLGDFVADEFQFGEISRVSREAPVLILRHREKRLLPGGGANAANNLAALGANVLPVTVVGDDEAGAALREFFRAAGVPSSGIISVKGRRTPTKTRFLAGWAHTTAQQVLRVDYEPQSEIPNSIYKKLQTALRQHLRGADALAISDYGFGSARPETVRVLRKKNKSIPITLDARYGLARYAQAGITAATPNEAELEALHGTGVARDPAALERCGRATLSALKLKALLVTRGRDGMTLFEPGAPSQSLAVHGSDEAVDVTGAGDTVLAAYTLALACKASPLEAAQIANIAGALVVMKRGTAAVSQRELLEAVRRAASGGTA
jgi:rfaE bifunctional protein kinase chain/domain